MEGTGTTVEEEGSIGLSGVGSLTIEGDARITVVGALLAAADAFANR
ncbi:hypothetical protein POF51_16360 [Brevibacillus sp. AG]|nr:hypothetical protein [Brevibacillus sp. AG]MDC0762282.1 hypothetical protein [Brevibacillus sp. AG]